MLGLSENADELTVSERPCEACHQPFDAGVFYMASDGVVLILCEDCHTSIFPTEDEIG